MIQQLTLSDFTKLVAHGITTLFAWESFLIIWEVNKIKQRNTRFYIELVEFEDKKVIAQTHAIIINQSILWAPLREWWMKLDELRGHQILATCTVRYHKEYGVQLEIHHISSEYTTGSIRKKTLTIKEELTALWIVQANKQKALWLPPYHIAIISSATSEWLKDFWTQWMSQIINSLMNYFLQQFMGILRMMRYIGLYKKYIIRNDLIWCL